MAKLVYDLQDHLHKGLIHSCPGIGLKRNLLMDSDHVRHTLRINGIQLLLKDYM